jgi:hypothetical protein
MINSFLELGIFGSLAGVSMCFSVYPKKNITVAAVSGALTLSSGVYCVIALLIMNFVFADYPLEGVENLRLASGLLGGGSIVSGLMRGFQTRGYLNSGSMNFTKHIMNLVLAELTVFPGLFYFLFVLFVQ